MRLQTTSGMTTLNDVTSKIHIERRCVLPRSLIDAMTLRCLARTTLSCETYSWLPYVVMLNCHYVTTCAWFIDAHPFPCTYPPPSCIIRLLNCNSRVLSEGVEGASCRVWRVCDACSTAGGLIPFPLLLSLCCQNSRRDSPNFTGSSSGTVSNSETHFFHTVSNSETH